jgi:glycosyltransferase involved in cell wall biosynthesis
MEKLFYVFSIDYQLISHRKDIVLAAVNAGYNVTVIAKDTGYKEEIRAMGVHFIDFPINRVGTNLKEEWDSFLFLYKTYRKHKPDLVHHISIKIVFLGGLAARFARVRNVVNAINGLGILFADEMILSLLKKCFMRVLKFSNCRKNLITIFQNNDDKCFFIKERILTEKQAYIINGSGVNLEKFRYVEPQKKNKLIIVFTSRMLREKGILDMIQAANILRDEYVLEVEVEFRLYGLLETNPRAINKQQLNILCDGEYIKYMGFDPNIKNVLEESDIVVLPSYYREGIPKSLIDATAIGRPIITTDWIGCKETVINGYNGFLVPIQSPDTIAKKLSILINNADLRKEMGGNSRKIAEKYFSLDLVVKKHLEIYKHLLQK